MTSSNFTPPEESLKPAEAEQLFAAARRASEKAYAPYSDFPVGAAVLCVSGAIITGANIENASYGLTLCAERVALTKALTSEERSQKPFKALAVWAKNRPYGAITPCGACRQFLQEFFAPDDLIVSSCPETGALQSRTMAALLPEAFSEADVRPQKQVSHPDSPDSEG